MKSIKVEDNIWERLTKLKLKYKFKSLSDLIDKMKYSNSPSEKINK